MIDTEYNVRRYITEFSEQTEELLAEYELATFSLREFQEEFSESTDTPMFDCYPISASKIDFIRKYVLEEPKWDFIDNSYFLEAHAITP